MVTLMKRVDLLKCGTSVGSHIIHEIVDWSELKGCQSLIHKGEKF
mgnify:CR=1 FL=1